MRWCSASSRRSPPADRARAPPSPARRAADPGRVRVLPAGQPTHPGVGLNKSGLRAREDLYLRCLELDGDYAPAWARLGRCYRLLGKAGDEPEANLSKAESCLRRALELNPQLAPAHNVYAQIETERGRPADGVTRLLQVARPESADPELFAGLVTPVGTAGCSRPRSRPTSGATARPEGPDERAAHVLAHRRLRACARRSDGAARLADSLVLSSMGREGEALSILRARKRRGIPGRQHLLASLRALLEGLPEESLEACEWVLVTLATRRPVLHGAPARPARRTSGPRRVEPGRRSRVPLPPGLARATRGSSSEHLSSPASQRRERPPARGSRVRQCRRSACWVCGVVRDGCAQLAVSDRGAPAAQ
jgi:hypothetical protein